MEENGTTQKSLKQIISDYRTGSVPRHECIHALIDFSLDDIKDILFEALHDNQHRVRTAAARILGKKGDETVVAEILHLLFDDSWVVRSSAQDALANLPPDISLPTFRGILASTDGDIILQKHIVSVLARYDDPQATDILINLYTTSNDEELKMAVIESIGRRRDESAMDYLFSALGDDSWKVRNTASKMLGNLEPSILLKRVPDALANPIRFVHMAVIEALIRIGDEQVIDTIADVIAKGNPTARLNAINVLLGIQSEESISLMVSTLNDPNAAVRRRAIEALGSSKSDYVFSLLKRCVKSENWNLKNGAIKTLGIIGTDDAVDLLEEIMKDASTAVKVTVLEVLATIGTRRCIRTITTNLSLPELGENAIRIIRSLDPDLAIKHLISMLSDEEYFAITIKALSELDLAKVQRSLSARIGSGSTLEQIRAIQALGILGGTEAEKFLAKFKETTHSHELITEIDTAIRRIKKKVR